MAKMFEILDKSFEESKDYEYCAVKFYDESCEDEASKRVSYLQLKKNAFFCSFLMPFLEF